MLLFWMRLIYKVSDLMDSNQPGYKLHHHDLHLKALFRIFQLLQEFLRKI